MSSMEHRKELSRLYNMNTIIWNIFIYVPQGKGYVQLYKKSLELSYLISSNASIIHFLF